MNSMQTHAHTHTCTSPKQTLNIVLINYKMVGRKNRTERIIKNEESMQITKRTIIYDILFVRFSLLNQKNGKA